MRNPRAPTNTPHCLRHRICGAGGSTGVAVRVTVERGDGDRERERARERFRHQKPLPCSVSKIRAQGPGLVSGASQRLSGAKRAAPQRLGLSFHSYKIKRPMLSSLGIRFGRAAAWPQGTGGFGLVAERGAGGDLRPEETGGEGNKFQMRVIAVHLSARRAPQMPGGSRSVGRSLSVGACRVRQCYSCGDKRSLDTRAKWGCRLSLARISVPSAKTYQPCLRRGKAESHRRFPFAISEGPRYRPTLAPRPIGRWRSRLGELRCRGRGFRASIVIVRSCKMLSDCTAGRGRRHRGRGSCVAAVLAAAVALATPCACEEQFRLT